MTYLKDVEAIKKRLAELPKGYISRKKIGGKERLYLQWREGGKVRSRYIKKGEEEEILRLVAERQELQRRLDEVVAGSVRYMSTGKVAEEVSGYEVARGGSAASGEGVASSKSDVPDETVAYYLKWADEVIGEIDGKYEVKFLKPNYNSVVSEYTGGKDYWSREEFTAFLADRIFSRDRRDADELLSRLGLTSYDSIQVGLAVKAINPRDLIWIAEDPEEKFEDVVTDVFESVFVKAVDLEGGSVDTPEGQNIKRYGVFDGRYGIFKKRLSPITTDVESELAAAALGERLGVGCCRCTRVDEDTVFSEFEYDFTKEHIVHFRHLVTVRQDGNRLHELMAARPEYFPDYAKMIALDFITRQDDRHLSNIAVRLSDAGESFYPLYDNGRCLFYEDTEETVKKACKDIKGFSTAFGRDGTYYDYILQLKDMGVSFDRILDLSIGDKEIKDILTAAGFKGYRLSGACRWVRKCIELLKDN